MRYWTIVTPDNDEANTPIYETLSEDEIIEQYWNYWAGNMIAKYGEEEFHKSWTKQDCIDDWVVIHWAWESEPDLEQRPVKTYCGGQANYVEPDQDSFCDSHCTWLDHHPDCVRADK